jgi:hypothetical protein
MVLSTLKSSIRKPIKRKEVLENIVINKDNAELVGGSLPTFKAIDDVEPIKKPKKVRDMDPSASKDKLKIFANFKFL